MKGKDGSSTQIKLQPKVNMGSKKWPSDEGNIFVGRSVNYAKNYDKIFMKKRKVYLAGAIEYAPDKGQKWREELIPKLEKIGIEILNPLTIEPKLNGRTITKSDPETYREWIREKVIYPDLEGIKTCTFIVVYWDEYVKFGGGTHGELLFALINNIPVYMVEGIGRDQIPGWIIGCTTKLFKSFKDLEEYLDFNE